MTVKDQLMLSWMAYLDLPPLYASLLQRGGSVPVAALADYTLRMDAAGRLECTQLNAAARGAAREMLGSDGLITGYINENDAGGFAAYTIRLDGIDVVAMRGSERAGACVESNVDWVDNVCEPFSGSVQLDAIRSLAGRFPEGRVIFTGHSKGGHNALLALSVSVNPQATAVSFNGQGFSADALDDAQKLRLEQRGVNYVVADDIVGALMFHPEKRVFVRQMPGTNAHLPEAFMFDTSGAPVPGRRTLRSYAIGAATRIADSRLRGDARSGVRAICRAALSEPEAWT